jgi:carboxymethylenebutenolidase
VTRLATVLLIVLFCGGTAAAAQTELIAPTANGPINVTLLAAPGEAPRPAVLILHGRQGIAPFAAAYTRYADDLAAAGIDAWLISYYSPDDAQAMRAPDRDKQIALLHTRIRDWMKTVEDVASFALAQKLGSGRIALLGFSNGGYIAVGAAAADPRFAAIVVFYGGILDSIEADISRLPPLLALHGDADRNVPVDKGRELVDRAKALGGDAELIVYPGAGHGFDFDEQSNMARGARARAIQFLANQLLR